MGMEYKTKDSGRVVDDMHQDSIVSGATDSGLCSASQNSDGVSPSPVGPAVCSDETLVSSVSADVEPQSVCGVTVAEAFQTDAQYGRGCVMHDADDGDDFGDFTNGVMIEEFAVFESPVVDGPTGSWATATQPVPAAIDDYDFDDFESADFQCAPVNCVGFDDGKVSICCVSIKSSTSVVQTRSTQPLMNSGSCTNVMTCVPIQTLLKSSL